ncbi:transcriptional regulator [Actinomadura sp. NBRC 104425]|uniref:helix-turn-helix domain-containing protein n=1 Tax=Actinomadura sp. NBRC 104425 TaxID=3032204 RepID=UPI0024A25150|nr:helix-turn-helix transcriptional regulator [Actinomadura sp. NBRC 104425]GLZ14512.1 transcriptional regulator [Actinomadura sp. NBRC 104425]
MTSPFVRRHRLGTELRALRQEAGLTAGRLADLVHYSRMKVSRLENASCRPDIPAIIKILKALNASEEKRQEVLRIACDASERGWWDDYGDSMGARQRLYADIEFGAATIRSYSPSTIPGLLQTPETIAAMIKRAEGQGKLNFIPEPMKEARLERQRIVLGEGGPVCEFILDEVVVRRLTIPAKTMAAQLKHIIRVVTAEPRLSLRILPVDASIEGALVPTVSFFLYTFSDPADPPMALVETINADLVHAERDEVERYTQIYDHLSRATLSQDDSLMLLREAADRLNETNGARQ